MNRSLRGPALYHTIHDYIKNYILENNLKPGDALPPEGQLVESLGVSRTSVREAVKSLQSVGIIEVRQGNGIYVRELNFDPVMETFIFGMQFDPNTLNEFLQIRTMLEVSVIGEAVSHLTNKHIEKLSQILDQWQSRLYAQEQYADLDEKFHQVIYGVLGNKTMMKLFSAFWTSFTSLDEDVTNDEDPQDVYRLHVALFEAIRTKDPDLSRLTLLRHFSYVNDRIDQYLIKNGLLKPNEENDDQ